jgi:hypothetical protein
MDELTVTFYPLVSSTKSKLTALLQLLPLFPLNPFAFVRKVYHQST